MPGTAWVRSNGNGFAMRVRQRFRLREGTQIVLPAVRHEDKGRMAQCFGELSVESRRMRLLGVRNGPM
jgi:hypothetical protein